MNVKGNASAQTAPEKDHTASSPSHVPSCSLSSFDWRRAIIGWIKYLSLAKTRQALMLQAENLRPLPSPASPDK